MAGVSANNRESLVRSVSFLSTTGRHPSSDAGGEQGGSGDAQKGRKKSRLPGGGKAIAAFFVSLVAFTIQTESAQYVQQTLGYRKPFLSLYLGHSSFILLFPMHLLYLRIANPRVPLSHYLHLIAQNIHWQVSTPTHSLPIPAADSIRRRISTLSMRSDSSSAYGEETADEFEVEELSARQHARRRNLGPPPYTTWIEEKLGFNLWKLLGLFAVLTVGITIPALSWYSAVPLTTMADITTIYNTYAVWALVFSIWFLGEKWQMRKVYSVLLACGGVILVAYGGAEHRRRPREPDADVSKPVGEAINVAWDVASRAWKREDGKSAPSGNALVGDLLAFFGAVTMAAYEMAFKIVGTLPDEEAQRERYARPGSSRNSRLIDRSEYDDEEETNQGGSQGEGQGLLDRGQGEEDADESRVDKEMLRKSMEVAQESAEDPLLEQETERTGLWKPKESIDGSGSNSYQTISPAPEEEPEDAGEGSEVVGGREERPKRTSTATVRIFDADVEQAIDDSEAQDVSLRPQEWMPPPLPFGMHPIIVTSGIGLVTLCTLWIGLPIGDALGWEEFEWPANWRTVAYIAVVVFTGIIFNGCFSILLAIWGPVLASVSCLLTTVLVFFADILVLHHEFRWISVLGCASIAAGFGVLVTGDSLH